MDEIDLKPYLAPLITNEKEKFNYKIQIHENDNEDDDFERAKDDY